jgi:Methyltransferase domain
MSTLTRRLKTFSKKLLRDSFELWQKVGIDVLPSHFYSEIPNISELRNDVFWQNPKSMEGINGKEIATQIEFMKDCCGGKVVDRLKSQDVYSQACLENGEPGFGFTEANFLYGFIYSKRPNRIIQVGCGVSTAIMLLASRDAGYTPEITCVDPYPTDYLKKAAQKGEIELIVEKAQKVSLDLFTSLNDRDVLFIDSTHTVKPGSEVNQLILEVLPRLKQGVWVHFHDIYFPYDYKRGILTEELFFSNESVLLQAFMIDNHKYAIAASLSMIYYAEPNAIGSCIPNFQPAPSHLGMELTGGEGHFPSSTYLRVVN